MQISINANYIPFTSASHQYFSAAMCLSNFKVKTVWIAHIDNTNISRSILAIFRAIILVIKTIWMQVGFWIITTRRMCSDLVLAQLVSPFLWSLHEVFSHSLRIVLHVISLWFVRSPNGNESKKKNGKHSQESKWKESESKLRVHTRFFLLALRWLLVDWFWNIYISLIV